MCAIFELPDFAQSLKIHKKPTKDLLVKYFTLESIVKLIHIKFKGNSYKISGGDPINL